VSAAEFPLTLRGARNPTFADVGFNFFEASGLELARAFASAPTLSAYSG